MLMLVPMPVCARAAVKVGLCKELLRLLAVHAEHPAAVAPVFFALRAVACNDDAVQQVTNRRFLVCVEAVQQVRGIVGLRAPYSK